MKIQMIIDVRCPVMKYNLEIVDIEQYQSEM